MRAILVLVGLVAVVVVVLMSLGMMTRHQPKAGMLPHGHAQLSGGELPEVKTGRLDRPGHHQCHRRGADGRDEEHHRDAPTIEVKQAPGATPTPAPKQ